MGQIHLDSGNSKLNLEKIYLKNSMVTKLRPSELSNWDKTLLFCICIAPAHSGLSSLFVLFSSCVVVFFALKNCTIKPSPQAKLIAVIFFVYFSYFYLNGAWVALDFMAPYESMRGNLPLLLIAVLCLFMSSINLSNLSAAKVGCWATGAVFLTLCYLIAVYLSQVYLPIFRSEIFNQIWHDGIGGRLKSYSRNALMFSSMFTTLGFLALIGFQDKTLFEKICALVALILALITVGFWSESRGALLASLPLIILTIWYLRPKLKYIFLLLTLVISIPFTLYATNQSAALKIDQTVQRIINGAKTVNESAQLEDSSVRQRITMYKLGIKAINESPFIGFGYQNRFNAILPYMEPSNSFQHGHLHNAFLNHIIAGGSLGLFIFLLLVLSPIALASAFGSCSRDSRFFAWIVFLSMAGIGMTTEVLGHYVHANFYGLLICAVALIRTTEVRHNKSNQDYLH
jgi:O-antigen ligase